MRGGIALLVVALAAAGCRSGFVGMGAQATAEVPSRAYVALPRLAEDLDLDYRGEGAGFIELSAPPDNVILIQDSRRALINGRMLNMDDPCIRRGDEFVVTSEDAALVSSLLTRMRSSRAPRPRPARPAATKPRQPVSTGLIPAWRPRARVRDWKYIVIHHSATTRGAAAVIHRGHLQRGMDGLGYHFVVGNGTHSGDGQVEVGYRWRKQIHGAHTRARPGDDNRWNLHGIGICLVGDFQGSRPSARQMDSLVTLVRALKREYGIRTANVVPHRFVKDTICPGPRFPWADFQARIR